MKTCNTCGMPESEGTGIVPPRIMCDVMNELRQAMDAYPPMHSEHEGYATLLEEVDELWDEVKKSPKKRDPDKIRAEAVQVAAMALRFLIDRCEKKDDDGCGDPKCSHEVRMWHVECEAWEEKRRQDRSAIKKILADLADTPSRQYDVVQEQQAIDALAQLGYTWEEALRIDSESD